MADAFDLQRFVDAQERVMPTVLAELQAGHKRTHWIWFVFPQLADLGRSPTAKHYGISGADEARAYLEHALLGPRLHECAQITAGIENRSILEVFGFPDNLKVRSSMTLFAHCGTDSGDFDAVLDRFAGDYDDGREDRETLRLLGK